MRRYARDIAIGLATQLLWVAVVVLVGALSILVLGTKDPRKVASRSVSLPIWQLSVAALVAVLLFLLALRMIRRNRLFQGREPSSTANVRLLQSRLRLSVRSRDVRGTRFGRWAAGEVLQPRSLFRAELDSAVLQEETQVRRIWNISSLDDAARLREIADRYRGRPNHSIRLYFDLPHQVIPEILIVGKKSSLSFPSRRRPSEMDWAIMFGRQADTEVISEYFEVMWERALTFLDGGELNREGVKALERYVRRANSRMEASWDS